MIPTRSNQVINGIRVLGVNAERSEFFTVYNRAVRSPYGNYHSRDVTPNTLVFYPQSSELYTHRAAVYNYLRLLYPAVANYRVDITFLVANSRFLCYSVQSDTFVFDAPDFILMSCNTPFNIFLTME